MHPVREAYYMGSGAEAYRRRLRYYPWYGRGLVQTTWERNYRELGYMLNPEDTDIFIRRPDLLLEWEWALPALFVAMAAGLYTGYSLDDFLDNVDESDEEQFREYRAARRVVNGTDRADEIGWLALHFEKALRAAGYTGQPPVRPLPGVPPKPVDEDRVSLIGRAIALIVALVTGLLAGINWDVLWPW
jgi:hypothetical protein